MQHGVGTLQDDIPKQKAILLTSWHVKQGRDASTWKEQQKNETNVEITSSIQRARVHVDHRRNTKLEYAQEQIKQNTCQQKSMIRLH